MPDIEEMKYVHVAHRITKCKKYKGGLSILEKFHQEEGHVDTNLGRKTSQ